MGEKRGRGKSFDSKDIAFLHNIDVQTSLKEAAIFENGSVILWWPADCRGGINEYVGLIVPECMV